MIRVNTHEAKMHLSRYLDRVMAGETIVICRRNVPIAELRSVAELRTEPRKLGQCLGEVLDMSRLDEPLPDELLDAFEGGSP